MRIAGLGWQLAPAFILTFLFLTGLISWLDNVHIVTTNGLWKTIQAEPWIHDFPHASLDKSNYLYFPLYGFLAHLLDCLDIMRGTAWKQFAYINAFWAGVCIVFVYAFFHRLTGNVPAAVFATLFHLGTGFFLLLAVINEDIMPGYTLVLGSMFLAGLWFDRPTYARIAGVATLFTLGWLLEWRLVFPTLPAFVLALAVVRAPVRQRLSWIAALMVAIVAVVAIVQQLWAGHNGAVGLGELFWTAKGIDTGWGGFTWEKLWLLLNGVSNYFLLLNVSIDVPYIRRELGAFLVPVILQAGILAASAAMIWPRRQDPRVRSIAIVFFGTFAAGEVLNLYSQPQDPQMQVNVMPWLTVAWGLLAAALLTRTSVGHVRWFVLTALGVMSLFPLVWNTMQLSHWRGGDTVALDGLRVVERNLPPESWVFVYWGFDGLTTWQSAVWGHTPAWDNIFNNFKLDAPPSVKPRFKWISIPERFVLHPRLTPEQQAQALKQSIDLALDAGYRIALCNFWTLAPDEAVSSFSFLPRPGDTSVIYSLLHDNYEAEQVLVHPYVGTCHELRHKSAPR